MHSLKKHAKFNSDKNKCIKISVSWSCPQTPLGVWVFCPLDGSQVGNLALEFCLVPVVWFFSGQGGIGRTGNLGTEIWIQSARKAPGVCTSNFLASYCPSHTCSFTIFQAPEYSQSGVANWVQSFVRCLFWWFVSVAEWEVQHDSFLQRCTPPRFHRGAKACNRDLFLRVLLFASVGMGLLPVVSYWFLCHTTVYSLDPLHGSATWELLQWGPCTRCRELLGPQQGP
jgi:hypothetical protein